MTENGVTHSIPAKDLACLVCHDRASGNHYGVPTCDGCRGFFKRSVRKKVAYVCKNGNKCRVDALRRNQCQACRLAKCLEVKMNPDAVQLQRETRTASKRKYDSLSKSEESDETPVKVEPYSIKFLSSPSIDSSMTSPEISRKEKDISSPVQRDSPPSPFLSRPMPQHPFQFPPVTRTYPVPFDLSYHHHPHPLLRPEFSLAMLRSGFESSSSFMTPPPFARSDHCPTTPPFPTCLNPIRGLPCLYYTCPLCIARALDFHSHRHQHSFPEEQERHTTTNNNNRLMQRYPETVKPFFNNSEHS